jgi:hypothetical protein
VVVAWVGLALAGYEIYQQRNRLSELESRYQSIEFPRATPEKKDLVVRGSLKIVDQRGVARFVADCQQDASLLMVNDSNGKPRIGMMASVKDGDPAGVRMMSADGKELLTLGSAAGAAFLDVGDSESRHVYLGAGRQGANVAVMDNAGKIRGNFGSFEGTFPETGLKVNFSESSIHLMDATGKVIWSGGE